MAAIVGIAIPWHNKESKKMSIESKIPKNGKRKRGYNLTPSFRETIIGEFKKGKRHQEIVAKYKIATNTATKYKKIAEEELEQAKMKAFALEQQAELEKTSEQIEESLREFGERLQSYSELGFESEITSRQNGKIFVLKLIAPPKEARAGLKERLQGTLELLEEVEKW